MNLGHFYKFIRIQGALLLVFLVGCGLQNKALDNRNQQEQSLTNTHPPSSTTSPPATVDINTGLILYYKFDEVGGTAIDFAGINDGFLQGTNTIPGKSGNAVEFNDMMDRVQVPHHPLYNFTRMTFSSWVYWQGSNGFEQRIFDRAANGNGTLSVYNFKIDTSGRAIITLTIGGTQIIFHTSTLVPQNVWLQLSFTYDGNRIKYFMNGQLIATLSYSGEIGGYPLNAGFAVGNQLESFQPFKGRLDEFMIFNRALSETDILALYNSQK